jgi:chromosome segregation ATPase
MTTSRYYIARLAQAFGYFRKNHRMADAASEMHLLREAETQLGAAIWQKAENIEELSVEYWNLRKLIKEDEIVKAKLSACQAKLDQAHQERISVLSSSPTDQEDLLEKRFALLADLEKLAVRRDEIVLQAREVRRTYDGMKMKLEVITNEFEGSPSGKEQIDKIKIRLDALKTQFSELKQQRLQIGREIEEGDAKVDLVDEEIKESKKQRRTHASEALQVIGDGNKEISILRAESALLDTQMRQLHAEIGRFVSRHSHQHSISKAISASHRGLVDVMRALRRSIALNHRLAGTD